MNPFHEILLYTRHASVIQTLPQQIFHGLGKKTACLRDWQPLEHAPYLLICDEETCKDTRDFVLEHPTMAVLVLGNEAPMGEHMAFFPLPISPAELLSRVETLLFDRVHDLWGKHLPLSDTVHYWPKERKLYTARAEQELTEKEHLLLLTLYHFSPAPVSRAFLLENVFGYVDSAETHTLETHLSRLRGKWKELTPGEHIRQHEGRYALIIHLNEAIQNQKDIL